MSGGGLGSTGVTQSGGGSSFGMNQPSQGMAQFSPQPMQQPMQGPFGGLGNMQVGPHNSTSQQNIFGGQQGMGQGFQQPMQQGPFGGQFGNMFGGPQFGFQQPQPFYQQQFNPYAMASQAQRLGISQVPIRNQYGPYGGQMYQQPYQMPYRNPMQQPMQQSQTNYPQPMQDSTSQQAPYGGFGNEQYQNKLNFARQQLAMRGIPQQQPSQNFDLTGQGVFRRGPMLRNVLPPEMQGQNVSNYPPQVRDAMDAGLTVSYPDLSKYPPGVRDAIELERQRDLGLVPRPAPPAGLPDVSGTFMDMPKFDQNAPPVAPMTAQDILKMAVGKSTPDLRYDSNGDGKITSADALAFQRSMQQKGMA